MLKKIIKLYIELYWFFFFFLTIIIRFAGVNESAFKFVFEIF